MELCTEERVFSALYGGCEGTVLPFWFVADTGEFVHGCQSLVSDKLNRVYSPVMTVERNCVGCEFVSLVTEVTKHLGRFWIDNKLKRKTDLMAVVVLPNVLASCRCPNHHRFVA